MSPTLAWCGDETWPCFVIPPAGISVNANAQPKSISMVCSYTTSAGFSVGITVAVRNTCGTTVATVPTSVAVGLAPHIQVENAAPGPVCASETSVTAVFSYTAQYGSAAFTVPSGSNCQPPVKSGNHITTGRRLCSCRM